MKRAMVTTIDNPFNPFEDWDSWYRFDEDHGYHTLSYMSRLAYTSHGMSEVEFNSALESAIDSIVELNVLGIYKKIFDSVEIDAPPGEVA